MESTTIQNLIDSIQFDKKSKKKSQYSESDSISSFESMETKEKSKVWSKEQAELFEILLKQMGTDFTLLSKFFPRKTKNQLKNRYKLKFNVDRKNRKEENSRLQALQHLFKEAQGMEQE